VVAATKSDLPVAWDLPALGPQERVVAETAATGLGVEDLEAAVVDALTRGDGRDEPPRVSNVRHVSLLDRAQAAVLRAAETLRAGGGEELVAADLREALEALQEVTGERAPDAVIEEIFARFCVGK
jgi:tRNA modification GTPase